MILNKRKEVMIWNSKRSYRNYKLKFKIYDGRSHPFNSGAGPFPIIVAIYGGGFKMCDKNSGEMK